MPFQSEKQRRYLWANEPEIARDWTDTYGSGIAKALGGRIGLYAGGNPYLPGLEPINTMNNPTNWNPITNEFEYNMGDRTEQLPLPGMNNMPSGYPWSMQGEGASPNSWMTDKRYVSNPNYYSDARYVNDIDSGIAGLSTDVFEPPAYETFNKDPNWWQEETGADMIKNPNFPLRKENLQELYETGKDKVGGILEYAKQKGIQGKDLLMSGLGAAVDLPLGLARMLGGSPDNPYQKFQKDMFSEAGYGGDANKDPWGKNVRSFADTYDVTDQWDKFAGSVLGQKYGLEAFGKDGLTDEEVAQLEKMGLKGYQLNRARGLSKFNQKALAWKKQKDDMIMKRENEARKIRKEKIAKEKVEAQKPTYRGPVTYDYDPKQGGGGRPDKPGGFTDPGKGSYGPWS